MIIRKFKEKVTDCVKRGGGGAEGEEEEE